MDTQKPHITAIDEVLKSVYWRVRANEDSITDLSSPDPTIRATAARVIYNELCIVHNELARPQLNRIFSGGRLCGKSLHVFITRQIAKVKLISALLSLGSYDKIESLCTELLNDISLFRSERPANSSQPTSEISDNKEEITMGACTNPNKNDGVSVKVLNSTIHDFMDIISTMDRVTPYPTDSATMDIGIRYALRILKSINNPPIVYGIPLIYIIERDLSELNLKTSYIGYSIMCKFIRAECVNLIRIARNKTDGSIGLDSMDRADEGCNTKSDEASTPNVAEDDRTTRETVIKLKTITHNLQVVHFNSCNFSSTDVSIADANVRGAVMNFRRILSSPHCPATLAGDIDFITDLLAEFKETNDPVLIFTTAKLTLRRCYNLIKFLDELS